MERNGELLLARTMHTDSSYCSASDAALWLPLSFFEDGPIQVNVEWLRGEADTFVIERPGTSGATVQPIILTQGNRQLKR
ncbi:MAG: hypothetical protein U5J83_09815 [Bryobacterales bacterium]|nr:hypothetical protein [Bryobacterales bacterium]